MSVPIRLFILSKHVGTREIHNHRPLLQSNPDGICRMTVRDYLGRLWNFSRNTADLQHLTTVAIANSGRPTIQTSFLRYR